MKQLINIDGITIRELKDLLKDLPEHNEWGEEFRLWILNTDGSDLSNSAKKIQRLNDGDLIIEI